MNNEHLYHHPSAKRSAVPKEHRWVTVINPTNHRVLLQACDDCGVVKSENSVIRNCKGAKRGGLISDALAQGMPLTA